MMACASFFSRSGLGPEYWTWMRCPTGIDDRRMQDLCQSALRLDLLVVAGDMRDIEGQGEGLRIVLDRVADDGARDAQALADDALTLRADLVNGHEVLGAGLGRGCDQIHDRSQDQQTTDDEFRTSHPLSPMTTQITDNV